jgi:hypothetical protein
MNVQEKQQHPHKERVATRWPSSYHEHNKSNDEQDNRD